MSNHLKMVPVGILDSAARAIDDAISYAEAREPASDPDTEQRIKDWKADKANLEAYRDSTGTFHARWQFHSASDAQRAAGLLDHRGSDEELDDDAIRHCNQPGVFANGGVGGEQYEGLYATDDGAIVEVVEQKDGPGEVLAFAPVAGDMATSPDRWFSPTVVLDVEAYDFGIAEAVASNHVEFPGPLVNAASTLSTAAKMALEMGYITHRGVAESVVWFMQGLSAAIEEARKAARKDPQQS